jgi:predicted ATPase
VPQHRRGQQRVYAVLEGEPEPVRDHHQVAAGDCAQPKARGQASQGRLFTLLLGVVQRLAATAPLLWVMEDLHWADRSTRDLLAYLATALRVGRVLLVGSYRSDEVDRLHPLRGLLGELVRNRRVHRLELPPFTRAELAEQLAGLGVDPSARLVDEIYARAEGNPFFTEELLLAGAAADPGVLPPSLRDVLLTRVVRLAHRTQQLLRVAAAAGPGASQPLLATVAGLDDQQLLAGLREAVDQQLLLPEPGAGGGYVFRHALLAEAVYSELLPGERVRLHTALAGALEAGLEAGDAGEPGGAAGLPLGGSRRPATRPDRQRPSGYRRRGRVRVRRGAAAAGARADAVGPGPRR